ncbi:MAG TPA: hypothetical protein VGU61_19880 [Noviherbaspirillum sp.]|jgi:hypothetical protein|uniref:hypothetical protein n=1 Tax=Noviherbaspirillum sp. TaxID=1926288 RepID=UPI002DDCCF7A|nr:hypothetical protein [Noviherbaspirillum sp.]HEV2612532.1 hypothetical protein [Noviherbaspirillum sp.]
MATKKDPKQSATEAAVLRDCHFGKVGDVVEVSAADAEIGVEHGMLDPHPDAVKAAKANKQ